MAEGCGSIFQREEALVAQGLAPDFFYADPGCPGMWT
jgi:hypothetical protein